MSGPVAGAYFEFDARVGVTGSPNVTAWADQSGNGRNLTGVNGTPKTNTRTINGQNAILFGNVAGESLYRLSTVIAAPYTVAAVIQLDTTSSATVRKWFDSGGGGTGFINTTWCGDAGTNNLTGGLVDNSPHVIRWHANGTSSRLYVDGNLVITAGVDAGSASTSYIIFGGDGGSGVNDWLGLLGHTFGYASDLSAADGTLLDQFLAYEWLRTASPIRVSNPRFWTPQGFNRQLGTPFAKRGVEEAAVTGTSATTNANDTSEATGGFGPSGTLARTNANDTSAAAGSTVTGSLARTNADDTSAATGGFGPSGTLARTNANDTSAAAGSTVTGSLARTNANDTSAASGAHGVAGTLARTNANDTSAATGGTGPSGTLARTNANDTVVATGSSVTGSLARTNANDTSVATGAAGGAAGTSSTTNANDTGVGVGAFGSDVVGTVAVTNANDTVVAAGSTVTGSSATTNANDLIDASGTAGEVIPPTVVESQPGGRANYTPSRETQEYWERERQRISAESSPDAILADDEEILVML